jgi:hypothetical protein
MLRLLRRCLPAAALLLVPAVAPACPFCSMQGQTLAGEVAGADMVLYGALENANAAAQTTDLKVESVIKRNDFISGKSVVTLPKYLDPAATGQNKFLVFCYVLKGNTLDPYRGMTMTADCVAYLKGVQDVKDKKPAERLKFYFKYLDSADPEISMDAFKEFANAPYADYRDMAKGLPADKLADWLKDPNTPGFRIGLYGSLLGHCGKEEHAKLLRSLLEDPQRKLSTGVDGVLAGYTMIDPKLGWDYVKDVMRDPNREFLMRYAALRAARFFHDYRPDLVNPAELPKGVAPLLGQKDIADLAVEDLRKWGCKDMAGQVLAMQDTDAYKTLPIVRRAVLRFALSFPDVPACGGYVAEQRKANPQGVQEAEEILKLEKGQ